MKELKVQIRDIQAQTPFKQRLQLPVGEPSRGVNTAIKTLQPQIVEEYPPQQRINTGWQRVAAQARRINQLATDLEVAILELKAIANELNRDRQINQATQKPIKSVCEYLTAVVPCVVRKKAATFVLTTRPIDLFRAEREASEVAQTLRARAKRRRVVVCVNQKLMGRKS